MFKRISLILICAFIFLGQAAYPLGLHAPLGLPDITGLNGKQVHVPAGIISLNLDPENPIMPISRHIEQAKASFLACQRSF